MLTWSSCDVLQIRPLSKEHLNPHPSPKPTSIRDFKDQCWGDNRSASVNDHAGHQSLSVFWALPLGVSSNGRRRGEAGAGDGLRQTGLSQSQRRWASTLHSSSKVNYKGDGKPMRCIYCLPVTRDLGWSVRSFTLLVGDVFGRSLRLIPLANTAVRLFNMLISC